jgi:hypothetical protein
LVLTKALLGAFGFLALERMQKKIAVAAIGGILSSMGKQSENPGLIHFFEERYEIVNCTWSGFHFVVSLCCFFRMRKGIDICRENDLF